MTGKPLRSQSLNEPSTIRCGTAADWCLRIVILLQCIGLSGKYVFSRRESESDVYGYLFFDYGWPEQLAQRIDDGGAIACLIAGVIVMLIGTWGWRGRSIGRAQLRTPVVGCIDHVALATVFAWFLIISFTHMLRGEPFASLSLGEHAVRYCAAAALSLLLMHSTSISRAGDLGQPWAMRLLVIASAATFVVHGYKAVLRYSPFTDLILLTDMNMTGIGLSQSTAESALVVIGIIDILVAALLMLSRCAGFALYRSFALYMVFWGCLTSLSRVTAYGWEAWPETLIRAANWGAPLAIVIYDGWTTTMNTKQDSMG